MSDQAIQELLDRQAIINCLHRFCRAVDRLDRDMMLSAYHSDAIDDHGQVVGSGADLFEWARRRVASGDADTTHHHITTHNCEIDGDTAHAETYFIFSSVKKDGDLFAGIGRYIDRLERRSGEWCIAMRYCVAEWAGTITGLPNPFFASMSDLHANGMPSRDGNDPSYIRPLVNRRKLRPIDGESA